MVEYFHVFVNEKLKFVSLSLAAASEYSFEVTKNKPKAKVKVHSYEANPKVLKAISDSYEYFK